MRRILTFLVALLLTALPIAGIAKEYHSIQELRETTPSHWTQAFVNCRSLTPYTNYFRALCTTTEHIPSGHTRSELVGGDWMAPDTANYVRSSTLKPQSWISVWARGNTDYGLNQIEISGYFTTEG